MEIFPNCNEFGEAIGGGGCCAVVVVGGGTGGGAILVQSFSLDLLDFDIDRASEKESMSVSFSRFQLTLND